MNGWGRLAAGLSSITGVKIREHETMARHTTLQIGGPADLYIVVEQAEALETVLGVLTDEGCPWLIAGAGSNLLVMDDGIEGAVVTLGNGLGGHSFVAGDQPAVKAGGAMALGALLAAVEKAGMSGLEFLTGIPGTVGGAVAMNAGTRYGYVDSTLESVDLVSAAGPVTVEASELRLGYRTSSIPAGSIVVSATLRLRTGRWPEGEQIAATLSELRRRNHPPASGTAGSFFRNPDPAADLFAGQLIEECGLKGCQVGKAVVSQKHANFLMNGGDATAADLLALARHVVDTVRAMKGVTLTREVRLVGRGATEWQELVP